MKSKIISGIIALVYLIIAFAAGVLAQRELDF
jgi:hypothetical protein